MLKDDFETFCSNIQLDNIEEINTTIKEITKKLNKHYYDIDDDKEHMYKVGSVGRGTAIKNTSDLDILFDLPKEIYTKYDNYESNGQSALLQEVKNILLERYPNTKMKGDGQVVVISFSKYKVELVPGFKQTDNRFKYPILKPRKSLKFYIKNINEFESLRPYNICWKVKNEGEVAKKRNMIRGQINITDIATQEEHTDFRGNHYVEAYIIKDYICIAKERIDVPIREMIEN